jgi:MFS family permease
VLVRGLRAIADGFAAILLPASILARGGGAAEVGALSTATLLGSAALTLAAPRVVARFGARGTLIGLCLLMAATGLCFAWFDGFIPLLLVAFAGTLNPSSGDVSGFVPVEHARLAVSVADRDRTALFARYSLAGSLLAAFGALLAAVPQIAAQRLGVAPLVAMRAMFLLYAAIGVAAAAIYAGIEVRRDGADEAPAPLGPSRRRVWGLAALFSVDAFGGGLFVQSLLALWLLRHVGLSLAATSALFSASSLLAAFSYLAAVPLARRIGLVNTMVWTHLPSNVAVMAIPFVSSPGAVVALWLLRSALSQMDVPTRSSYVMAVVTPGERAAAASTTAVPRSLASAVAPSLAGPLFASGFGWPLLLGGALKGAYDLALLASFRRVRPPEEV